MPELPKKLVFTVSTNLAELQALLDQASRQAGELAETVNKINDYELELEHSYKVE